LQFGDRSSYFDSGMNAATQPSFNKVSRFSILDALRFVLAFWVVMGHVEVFPLFGGADTATKLGRFVTHAWSSLVWGVPAVIVFFVISGFCIHFPFRKGEKLLVGRYYLRRYTRVLIPVAGAVCLYRLLGNHQPFWGRHSILWNSVLWSLLCEEIYYAVYPVIRLVRKQVGWPILLFSTFVLGACTALTHLHTADLAEIGPLETAIILYPVWLLGCVLAEECDRLPPLDSAWVIWRWRFLAWAGSWICEMLNFKAGIYLTQTMLLFGILAYFWIRKEIQYSTHREPYVTLAVAGTWSYSLYLVHDPAARIFSKFPPLHLGYIPDWCFLNAFILGFSYLFYLAIERPSHQLAKKIRVIQKLGPGRNKEEPGLNINRENPEPQSSPVVF